MEPIPYAASESERLESDALDDSVLVSPSCDTPLAKLPGDCPKIANISDGLRPFQHVFLLCSSYLVGYDDLALT